MNILVAGLAFLDMKGFSFNKYDPIGTNPGSVTVTHGGVARNVAEDLAYLGANVDFLTLLEDAPLGQEVRYRLESAGVSLSHAATVSAGGIGMWLAVFDEKGELAGSVSKMPDVQMLEGALDEWGDEMYKAADAVVVEYDTSYAIARKACELAVKYNKPLYVIVGNMSVMLANKELLSPCNCTIMNEIEAGKLFNTKLTGLDGSETLKAVQAGAKRLKLKSVIITMGPNGCVYIDGETGECGCVPGVRCDVVDTTGAGDAFFSAAVITLTAGKGLRAACENGVRLATSVVSAKQSACSKDSRKLLEL